MDSRSRLVWTVTIYFFLMAAFIWAQPSIAFGREGRIRPFGTQDKEATVFPLWWWIFVIAVVAYCITLFFSGFRV
jgi:drug/metabolite transporter (DMT)-like permease